jgi:hypothetical protein
MRGADSLFVCEAVVRVPRRALAEQGVRFVEQQRHFGLFGAGDQLREILLGLADVLAGTAARSTR